MHEKGNCVKAIGSAEGTGRLVGTSVGAAAPTLSTIPFVGWVAAGWWPCLVVIKAAANIGGNMSRRPQ